MAESNSKQVHTTHETTSLKRTEEPPPPPRSWTKQDYIATAIYLLVQLGESVEVYLPGVINQVVSCELGVSHFQEGVLGVALNTFFALSMVGTAVWTGR